MDDMSLKLPRVVIPADGETSRLPLTSPVSLLSGGPLNQKTPIYVSLR